MEMIDKSNMRQVILDSPKQLSEGLDLANNVTLKGNFKNIIICGMGGSAWPMDVLNTVMKVKVPIYINRDYNLPETADEESLIICISYSGNTEEGLSSFKDALNKKLTILGISSGGKLETLCQQNSLHFIKIPSGIPPREATGYLFASVIKVLETLGIVEEMSPEILNVAEQLKKVNTTIEEEGKVLATKIKNKIPVVYASNNFAALAKIWKIKFNENSKIPAFWNVFPELNHNEMVGYENEAERLLPIMIRDTSDHPRIQKRMDLMADLLLKKGIESESLQLRDGSLMFKVFSNLLLGDWTSYYLAINKKIDPTPVKIVEDFKKLLG